MPAPVPADTRKLLTLLFWGGVALAPVAALILLVADGNGPLRFAAVLAILAVVLIGLSIALRTDGGGPQAEVLREEVDELRRELRGEIVAAAQRGNQALDEVQRVQEALAGLRRRVDSGGVAVANDEPPGPGRARVPAPEAPSRPAERVSAQAGVYGTAQPGPGPTGGYGGERQGPTNDRPASGSAGVYGSPGRPEQDNRPGEHGPRPLGVVRHTETVHVTTRHTIVDGGVGESGGRYGGYQPTWSGAQPGQRGRGGPGTERDDTSWSDGDDRPRRDESRRWSGTERPDDHSWSGAAQDEERQWSGSSRADERSWSGSAREPERAWSPPQEESRWSAAPDDWSTARGGGSGYPDEPARDRDDRDWSPRDDQGWEAGGERWETPADPVPAARGHRADDTGQYWAQLRAGDRWAAVRDDDRGRELRVGERRAELHADPAGTEYRVEDRWASVRRDEPHRDVHGDDARRDGWGEPESRPALPAGGVPVPQEWRPPRQRGHQPEPARAYQPEPVRGYQSEPAYGYQPETTRGQRPGGEQYGRRHQVEEPGYGPAAYDGGAGRWR
ncbi:hypothetical protein [Micromonospora andamanensis]|uniref:hypothetical protein n=1 Tax=Micromonospora andamanensis TaxID=1287068 RepID=UPI0019521235|nr:hypothetical protein [Micromonospora andamanensis]GIJ37630.1 hypothetical protein Vwe01_09550 [Micromonospora andamanensis]